MQYCSSIIILTATSPLRWKAEILYLEISFSKSLCLSFPAALCRHLNLSFVFNLSLSQRPIKVPISKRLFSHTSHRSDSDFVPLVPLVCSPSVSNSLCDLERFPVPSISGSSGVPFKMTWRLLGNHIPVICLPKL